MRAIDQTVEEGWLEELLYFLIGTKQFDYCYVLQNVSIIATMKPFAFCDGAPVHAACGMDESGQLQIKLYWPILSRLSFEARLEILQHEVLHIIEGHISSFGNMLYGTYGCVIANMAMDIVVNQKYDRTHSTAEGLPGTRLEHFKGLPPHRGSIEYAEILTNLNQEGKLSIPMFSTFGTDPLAGTAGQPGDDFTGKGARHVMSELLQFDESSGVNLDSHVRGIITSVTEALKLHGDATAYRFRGLLGSDNEEFMRASKRRSAVPWSRYLRTLESRSKQQVRTTSRRRPSRRHPAYFGHTWKGGLTVVMLVDTSGSMGVEELKLVDPELKGLHARGADITVIHTDAGVAKVQLYRPSAPLENFVGRGGTDYSSALEYIRQMYPKPDYVIGYTDGFGSIGAYRSIITKERGQTWWENYASSNPEKSPDGIPTIWLLPESCMSPDDFRLNVCPWGRALVVPRDHAY